MKKWFSVTLCIIMMLGNMVVPAFASENEILDVSVDDGLPKIERLSENTMAINAQYSSKEVEGYWHLSDGVLSYTTEEAGAINFDEVNPDDVKKVVIGSGPTRHHGFRCRYFENLEEVVYEAPVTLKDMCIIDVSMFRDCPKLRKLTVGKPVKGEGMEYDAYAFDNCPSLTEVNIDNGTWHFGRRTFGNCTGLTSFKFPDDMHDIRGDSFWGCENLTNISMASTNPFIRIENNAAYEYHDPYNDITCGGITRPGAYITPCQIFVPNGVIRQNNGNYTIAKGIKDIQFWAFFGNEALKNITLASTVESIQLEAFLHCNNIESVTLPKSLKRVGQNVFSPEDPGKYEFVEDLTNVNHNLKDIYYQGSEEEWKQIEFAIYHLNKGLIDQMTIEGRDSEGKILPNYEKLYLYDHLELAGIPADVNIHFNSELIDSEYTVGKPKKDENEKKEVEDVIYQETNKGAPDDNCILEKKDKDWVLTQLDDEDIYKITLAKGNKIKLPDFATLVSGDDSKSVTVSKKGYLSAKKDSGNNTVSIEYKTTNGEEVKLNVRVIMPVFSEYVSVSNNAVTKINKLNVSASLRSGEYVDAVLYVPFNFSINMSKVKNKCGADCTMQREDDGRVHLKAKVSKKGTVKIPVKVNGKTFNVSLSIKK